MDDERLQRIHRILSCSETLVHGFNPSRERLWFELDLTMPQMKTLIYVIKNDGPTSGQIANGLGVTLSTITGIVDRLEEQKLVMRHEDRRDRRITRVVPTARGKELADGLFRYRNEVVTAILSQLDEDQLETVEKAFQYLVDAASNLNNELPAKTEAVA